MIQNIKGAPIYFVNDSGSSKTLGSVLSPVIFPQFEPFTSSRWAKSSSASASSVNVLRIHLSGIRELCIYPRDYNPEIQSGFDEIFMRNFIKTDIEAGTGLFREYAPTVGSSVFLLKQCRESPFPAFYTPEPGDTMVIHLDPPKQAYKRIVISNTTGGKVYGLPSHTKGCTSDTLSLVIKPVSGIGRFGGSAYCNTGEIRANHPGVICISTSPKGKLGGFQIIPDEHADDEEIYYSRNRPQWMILKSVNKTCMAGSFPLFSGLLKPGQRVMFSKDGNYWEAFPEMEGKIDDALQKIGVNYLLILCDEVKNEQEE